MLNKRGQVTLFVILAIIIVAGIVVFLSFRDNLQIKPSIPTTIQPIHNFVQNCLEETSENSLIRIGNQGGYFLIFDEPSIEGRIPYYVYEGQNLVPTKNKVEAQISGFVKQELSYCILNFKDFQIQYDISHNLKEVQTDINGRTFVEIDYPISIKKGDSVVYLNEFQSVLPLDIGKELFISNEIAKNILSEEGFCISCIYDIAQDYNVQIDMLDYGEGTIFKIIDNSNKLNNQSYEWSFAVK